MYAESYAHHTSKLLNVFVALQRCTVSDQYISAYYLHCHSRQADAEILYSLEETANHGPFD